MKGLIPGLIALAVTTPASAQPSAGPGPAVTAFVNVTLVPMDRDHVERGQTVRVDGHPLQDLAYLRRPAGVMVRGKWLTRTDLQQRLAALKADAPSDSRR